MDNSDSIPSISRRLVRTWAEDAAAHAVALARIDPSWGTSVDEFADGWLILAGKGMYVNRAMGVGLDSQLSSDEIAELKSRSAAAGVTAAIEVSAETDRGVITQLVNSGFVHNTDADFSALVRPIPGPEVAGPDEILVRPVRTPGDLRIWQETSALGWGHTSEIDRRASDAFAAAAFEVEPDGLMIAFNESDMTPMGCASITIRDKLATLGGMSTVPDYRRRGVQAAFVRRRIDHAVELGCDLAATTAATGGPSERNLMRHGFSSVLTIQTFEL